MSMSKEPRRILISEEREELERQDCAMCCDCAKSSKGMRYNG